MAVDRCVCQGLTFAQLQRIARDERLGFAALRQRTGCGAGCGLCAPYVRLMLRTGATSFDVLPPATARAIMDEPDPGPPQGL